MDLRTLCLFVATIYLAGCDRSRAVEPTPPNPLCTSLRSDTPCRISSYQLISETEHFDGSFVEVMLYFGPEDPAVGYVNRDAQINGDTSSSFIVSKSATETITRGGYWRVWGKFQADQTDRRRGLETYRQAGVIDQVMRLDPISPPQD